MASNLKSKAKMLNRNCFIVILLSFNTISPNIIPTRTSRNISIAPNSNQQQTRNQILTKPDFRSDFRHEQTSASSNNNLNQINTNLGFSQNNNSNIPGITGNNISQNSQNNPIIKIDTQSLKQPHVLSLNLPKDKELKTLFCYYKGYRLSFDNNKCLFNENQNIDQFILIITDKVSYNNQTSIAYLKRDPERSCKLFYLKKITPKNFSNQTSPTSIAIDWQIEEEAPDNIPLRLPDNSFVILFNPNLIDNLSVNQPDNTKAKAPLSPIVNLPIINIKANTKQSELDESATYSLLSSMDINCVHKQL